MNYFEIIIINTIYITFPIVVWLFFMAYNKNIGKVENELFFDFTLFSILYCVIRFSPNIVDNIPLLIVNIPLFLAFLKRRYMTGLYISTIIIVYYIYNYDMNMYILIIEYILYYVCYLLWLKTKISKDWFLSFLIILKSILLSVCLSSCRYINLFEMTMLKKYLFLVFVFAITGLFALFLCNKGEDIIKFHLSLKELEKEKQIKSSLFRITHEIKNPIAVCKGYLDMFDVNNPEHSKKYIPILREEIERTLILLQDFLSMTKIKINKEIIDVNMVLEDVVDNFVPILKENKIIGDFDISEESVYIYGDYNRLSQTFINIIKNSVEAIDSGKESMIKVYTKINKDNIKIYIVDNGLGISKENLKKISEPFFTTKQNGTGLGVSLSYEIIQAHDGKIIYESEEGIGTKVEITLPLTKTKRLS